MVDAVDLEIVFSDPTGDGAVAGVMLKNFTDNKTLQGTTISSATERPTCWTRPLNDSGSQVVVYRKHVDLPEMLGLTKSQFEGGWDSLSSLTSNNPAITPYVTVAVADLRANLTAISVECLIKIRYHCVFFGRNTVERSV